MKRITLSQAGIRQDIKLQNGGSDIRKTPGNNRVLPYKVYRSKNSIGNVRENNRVLPYKVYRSKNSIENVRDLRSLSLIGQQLDL